MFITINEIKIANKKELCMNIKIWKKKQIFENRQWLRIENSGRRFWIFDDKIMPKPLILNFK